MFYRQELCDLNDHFEGEICLRIAGMSLRNSKYTLVSGSASGTYFDMDSFLANKDEAKKVAEFLAEKINHLSKDLVFDKIGFIEKGGGAGPIGLFSMSSLIATLISKEILIVRPKKRLLPAAIKGSFRKGDKVLLVSDVATAGWTIFNAAEKIWDAGGTVPYALVVVDRDQGATVNLGRKGIELFSLFSAKSMREEKGPELVKEFEVVIEDRFNLELIDFGGKSSTAAF